ncbi:hypothetical protein B0H19DRAFT_1131192 [Mycena capillaripes]|nr:hypothetical protein B0H19DRAFT_1131192 [Mycena capillaripes]
MTSTSSRSRLGHFQTIAFVAALLFLFILSKSCLAPYSIRTAIRMASEPTKSSWTSRYAEWHSRAKPHPSPASFYPTRAALSLAVLRNSPTEPEGFTLALFDTENDKVAVDAMGRVLLVEEADYIGVTTLAQRVASELPETGRFRNTWVIDHPTTSQPIDRLLIVSEGHLTETSVQGFVKGKNELKIPVGDITELPEVLSEVIGLVLEGRTDYSRGSGDSEMVQKVKDILAGEN